MQSQVASRRLCCHNRRRREDLNGDDGQQLAPSDDSNNPNHQYATETSEATTRLQNELAIRSEKIYLVEPEMGSRREKRRGKTRPRWFISLFLHILLFSYLEEILLNFKVRRRRRRSCLRSDKIRFCLLICLLMKLANSYSILVQSQESVASVAMAEYSYPNLEPQPLPLAYQSVREFGSGDGAKSGHLSLSSSSSSSSVSPSLISAKCWNNYENDNDCKQINVITGNANGQPMTADDDSIITPIVIFESSSTIEPFQSSSGSPQQPQVFLSQPYYEGSSEQKQSNSATTTRHRATTPKSSDVSLMPEYQPPNLEQPQTNWQPTTSTENMLISTTPRPTGPITSRPRGSQFVATPKPKKPLKSTTAGRRCRDENDDDCDEPDDVSENEDDGEKVSSKVGSLSSSSSLDASSTSNDELGSGLGPNDDNEDDADDPAEPVESSGNFGPSDNSLEADEGNQYGTQVTTSGAHDVSTGVTKQAGAEIEVLVHPTLPPLFPTTSTTAAASATASGFDPQETQVSSRPVPVTSTPSTTTTTTTTTTTMMPDDTYTSKPIFPSSTSPTTLSPGDATSSLDPIDAIDAPSNSGINETSADLYKFVPMPLPTMEPPPLGIPRRVSQLNQSDSSNNNLDRVNEWNRFEPGERVAPGRFGDFAWQQQQARQRPTPPVPTQLQPDVGPSPPPSGTNSAIAQPVAREMLPHLLLYACLVVLMVTASIFIIMAFVLWRRNAVRHRQLLLNKSAMLNGFAPGGGHLPPSMSHASQLVANMQQQPRLLGAYGSAAGANGLGKVTASIVEEDENASLLNNGLKEHGKGAGKYGGRGDASWTENSEPTTTSGESIKTGDSQQEQVEMMEQQQQQQQQLQAPYQNQSQQHQQRLLYPNSLSDGRQNSSSISDSSPIDGSAQMTQPIPPSRPIPAQQQPHYSPDPNHVPYLPLVPPPHIQRSPMNLSGYQQQQQDVGYHLQQSPMNGCANSMGKRFSASRSVEDLQPGSSYHQQAPMGSQYPLQQPPAQPIPQQQQFYPRRPSQEVANFPRTLAMNPLATLSRRYPLQRNIYSEDSSSFTITASPSLARTSSSSSFAFNSSQVSSVRMKPLVDAAGRLFNDYTPTGASSYASSGSSVPPPPVLGRKERSEAWYV